MNKLDTYLSLPKKERLYFLLHRFDDNILQLALEDEELCSMIEWFYFDDKMRVGGSLYEPPPGWHIVQRNCIYFFVKSKYIDQAEYESGNSLQFRIGHFLKQIQEGGIIFVEKKKCLDKTRDLRKKIVVINKKKVEVRNKINEIVRDYYNTIIENKFV